jgi:hypothetical protein
LAISRDVGSSLQGSPKLWPQLEGEEIRGLNSRVVSVDGIGTATVEAVKALPVPGMQKPPRWVGKRFRDCFVAALEKKGKKPAGLQMRPAWLRQDCLGTNPAVGRGDAGFQAWRPLPNAPLPQGCASCMRRRDDMV